MPIDPVDVCNFDDDGDDRDYEYWNNHSAESGSVRDALRHPLLGDLSTSKPASSKAASASKAKANPGEKSAVKVKSVSRSQYTMASGGSMNGIGSANVSGPASKATTTTMQPSEVPTYDDAIAMPDERFDSRADPPRGPLALSVHPSQSQAQSHLGSHAQLNSQPFALSPSNSVLQAQGQSQSQAQAQAQSQSRPYPHPRSQSLSRSHTHSKLHTHPHTRSSSRSVSPYPIPCPRPSHRPPTPTYTSDSDSESSSPIFALSTRYSYQDNGYEDDDGDDGVDDGRNGETGGRGRYGRDGRDFGEGGYSDDGHYSLPGARYTDAPYRPRPRAPRRWWYIDLDLNSMSRRRGEGRRVQVKVRGLHALRRGLRLVVRHPLFPRQPWTIVFTLLLLTVFGVSLTLLLMYILNPDKEPLPWRAYCSLPPTTSLPPAFRPPSTYPYLDLPLNASSFPLSSPLSPFVPISQPTFPPPHLDLLPPTGIFLGVFSTDSALERRMLIRTTWASHPRSRGGAGVGDGGWGTSRVVVRFILGQPRKGWERRIQTEMELYNDIIILPCAENMNSGKTHAYFTWAASNAWVPPIYPSPPSPFPSSFSSTSDFTADINDSDAAWMHDPPVFSYSNMTAQAPAMRLAAHDSVWAWEALVSAGAQAGAGAFPGAGWAGVSGQQGEAQGQGHWNEARAEGAGETKRPLDWVRPDFVVKGDDDTFVMLAELEARLRVEAYRDWFERRSENVGREAGGVEMGGAGEFADSTGPGSNESSSSATEPRTIPSSSTSDPSLDPLIYWGYLVKDRFMAGELYALSFPLVEWVARDPGVRAAVSGAEDKVVAGWMGMYPRAREVRWVSERCWIYDHPRAGTVYSHGFLFPSEATRVRKSFMSYWNRISQSVFSTSPSPSSPLSPYSHAHPHPDAVSNPDAPDAPDASPASLQVEQPPSQSQPQPQKQTRIPLLPSVWAFSSVSQFGVHYKQPLPDMTMEERVEALVEGSVMSSLVEGSSRTPEYAWTHREGRAKRYEGNRVGGTVVVHFIKKHMWFLETAMAFLGGVEYTEVEWEGLRAGVGGSGGYAQAQGTGEEGSEHEGTEAGESESGEGEAALIMGPPAVWTDTSAWRKALAKHTHAQANRNAGAGRGW